MREISIPSLQLCCEPKLSLKSLSEENVAFAGELYLGLGHGVIEHHCFIIAALVMVADAALATSLEKACGENVLTHNEVSRH